MRGHRIILSALAAPALALALAACDDPKAASTTGAASASAAPAALDPPVRFPVEPFGAAVFTLKAAPGSAGKDAKDVKGLCTAVSGELSIVPSDLSRTRGAVEVDLRSLATHGIGDDALDGEVTGRVRDWLEVGPATLKEPLRTARFTVRSIDQVSERSVFDVPRDTRTVTLKTTGDLELHGVKVERKLDLMVTFEMNGGALSRVTVRTAEPLTVSLAAHGVKASGVGDEASVTFEVSAKAARP